MGPDEVGWPLEKVLDTVGLVLAGTVLIRAVGGLVAGLGVSSFHVDLGAPQGSGIQLGNGLVLPTALRLQYGTSWADVGSGLALLAAAGLITLPRMVWDVPRTGRWATLPARFMLGIGVLAVLTSVGGVIGTVNLAWNVNHISGPAEAVNIAAGVAAVALAALCAALSWFSLPYLLTSRSEVESTPN